MFPNIPNTKQTLAQRIKSLPPQIKVAVLVFGAATICGVVVFTSLDKVQSPAISTEETQQDGSIAITSSGTSTGSPKTTAGKQSTTNSSSSQQEKATSSTSTSQSSGSTSTNQSGTSTSGTSTSGTTQPTTPTSPSTPTSTTFPGSSNSGIPAGTSLTSCPSSTWNTSSNVTYDSCNFTGGAYTFTGNNVTIRNSRLAGGVLFYGDNILIEHSSVSGDGINLSGTGTVNVRYNQVYNFTSDAVHITADTGSVTNVTFSYNYIHNPTPDCGAHADGIQIRGVTGLTVHNNTIDMGPWAQVCGQDALNAALFFEDANGGNSGITITNNYLSGGGYTVYFDTSSGQVFKNNAFGGGHYGYAYPGSNPADFSDRSGNYIFSNGAALTF